MDPFLPGEIPVMVLRYLAANKCETATLALIEEMPLLKSYVPPKPAKLSNSEYVKGLARSTVNSGLKYLLLDYGNSKILAEEILENESNSLSDFPSDGLLSKLKTIKGLIKTKPQTSSASASPTNSAKKTNSEVVKVDSCSNTEVNYLCPQCLVNQANSEQKTESSCQTEEDTGEQKTESSCQTEEVVGEQKTENSCQTDEVTGEQKTESSCQTEEVIAVQFGLQDEIPVIYRRLLNDDDLQQKIAQTATEHLGYDVAQSVSSKAENAIDKFLVELLQDMPEDSNEAENDGGLQNLAANGPSVYEEVDSNLMAMFGESEMLFGKDPDLQTSTERDSQKSLASSSSGANSNPKDAIPETESLQIPVSLSSTSPDTESETITNCGNKKSKPQSASSGLFTPKQLQRGSSVKRITPTPLTSANVNPVFNTSVVIETQVVEGEGKSAKFSVVTVNSEPPAWQKLHRKPIAPKIPGLVSPKVTDNITVVNKKREEVIKYCGGSKTNGHSVANDSRTKERINSEISPPCNNKTTTSHPTSSHKRKAPPVKLTPEKAKSMQYNFIPVQRIKSNEIVTTPSNVSSAKKTPVASSSVEETGANVNQSSVTFNIPLVNENSQNDVTPMQPPPQPEIGSSSDLKTISPKALNRLIASAHKHMGSTAAPVHFPKRKSYSTPRKRKHVRNLSFATPPSLKGTTPQNGPDTGASKKRKAEEESFAGDLKSKKRLNWPESEKKKIPQVVAQQKDTTEVETTNKDVNSKGHRGKGVRKKPKIIMKINSKDLFGDPPSKNKNLTKRSPEAVAAQMVAGDALPLGILRRSPRKHPIMTKQLDKSPFHKQLDKSPFHKQLDKSPFHKQLDKSPFHKQLDKSPFHKQLDKSPFHKPVSQFGSLSFSENSENSVRSLPLLPPQENTVFNIVPAPLGFPEPTPIKNYNETGYLNISGIGFNSPLITPLKSNPPPPLNDTHFTLPPTPRIVVDQDSNSNSMHSLKLIYDGLYPVNLLTSTPLKSGLPRTPGKESSSSNSHSPLLKPAGGEPTGTSQTISPNVPTPLPPPPSTNPHQRVAVTNNVVATTNATALDLSSPRDKDKSDGELSSSDSDLETSKTTSSKTKSLKQVQKVVPLPPQQSTFIPPPRHPSNMRPYNTSYATQVVHPLQQHHPRPVLHPQISISVSQNIGQTRGISFQVGGHKKMLTLSEHETVVSLMQMQNTGHPLKKVKETAPVRATDRPTVANLQKPSANVTVPEVQKPNAEASNQLRGVLQGMCVEDLIKMVHRKHKLPPKNN